jgi:hypothetical protein
MLLVKHEIIGALSLIKKGVIINRALSLIKKNGADAPLLLVYFLGFQSSANIPPRKMLKIKT